MWRNMVLLSQPEQELNKEVVLMQRPISISKVPAEQSRFATTTKLFSKLRRYVKITMAGCVRKKRWRLGVLRGQVAGMISLMYGPVLQLRLQHLAVVVILTVSALCIRDDSV
jgi:hypothetical protein